LLLEIMTRGNIKVKKAICVKTMCSPVDANATLPGGD